MYLLVTRVFAVEQKPEQECQPGALSLSQPNSQSCKSLIFSQRNYTNRKLLTKWTASVFVGLAQLLISFELISNLNVVIFFHLTTRMHTPGPQGLHIIALLSWMCFILTLCKSCKYNYPFLGIYQQKKPVSWASHSKLPVKSASPSALVLSVSVK